MAGLFGMANEELQSVHACLPPSFHAPRFSCSSSGQAGGWEWCNCSGLASAASRHCSPQAARPWPRHFASYSLSVLICRMGAGMGSVPWGRAEVKKIPREKGRARCWHKEEARSALVVVVMIISIIIISPLLEDDSHAPIPPIGMSVIL